MDVSEKNNNRECYIGENMHGIYGKYNIALKCIVADAFMLEHSVKMCPGCASCPPVWLTVCAC